MVIRIKKKLYFKPRLCPDCGKPCLFCKCHLSQRCKQCHKKHDKKRHNRRSHLKRRISRKRGLTKYTHKYQRMRKQLINEHPYCSLCGSEIRLTVHHVGGECEHYTVLCDDCHQAYERWNNIRKAKLWKKQLMKNRLTGGLNSWKNIMRRVQFRCRICFCRIQMSLALGHQEAHSAVLSSARENITN